MDLSAYQPVAEQILDTLISAVPGNPAIFVPEEKEAIHLLLSGIIKLVASKSAAVNNTTTAAVATQIATNLSTPSPTPPSEAG